MTPSSNRPISPRTTSRTTRRASLLAASALAGSLLGGVAVMLAPPAQAGTLPGIPSAANITVSSGGAQPFISFPDAITLQIDLNAPRTVINWTDLHLSSGDAMNFLFDAASDIVLNKTTSQIRFDNGSVVTGKVGAATAGNVWFYSPQGVIVSPGATMTAGGFLFSKGTGLNDASFVAATDPLANLRAATDALIQMTTVSSATTASIDAAGNVLLSASSGALNVSIAEGATVGVSTTSGSITASEVTATSGAASVTAGGPGATVTQITGDTGVTVSSNNNTSVGAATTTTSGDILITSNGSASLTLGNSARDVTLSAPQVFVSTVDAGRDVFVTGTTSAFVTNRIFAGDDIEITANGDVTASGAYLKSTGFGATDDAHILVRSDTGFANAGNTLLTQGTGAQAGDITIQAATTATLGTADSTRDIKVVGATSSLANGTAARDIAVTATTGTATVTTAATAGDDVIINANGDVIAGGATLKGTGTGHVGAPGSYGGSYVYVASAIGAINVGSAITEGTGTAAGDVVIAATTTATLGSGSATRDLNVSGTTSSLTSGSAARDLFVDASSGNATITTSATAGDDVEITAAGGAVLASGATLKSTGVGATDDAHVLARSTTGSVNVGSAVTQGTGAQAGDITIQAAAASAATLGSGDSTRDLTISGASASLTTGQSGRDLFVTATTGNATVTTYAIAGDDLEITTTSGNVLASNANLWGGYSGGSDDGHVLVRSTNGSVNVLSAESRGGGVTAGDTTIQAGTTATVGGAFGSRNLTISGAGSFDLSGLYSANNTASFTSTAGAITESGGSVAAATLTLNGATGVTLDLINNISNLGASSSGTGSFTYRDVNNFALTGNITSGGDMSLFSNNGAVTQTAGVITADTLNVSAETGISLNQANLVTSLGDLTNGTSGAISFHNDGGFDLTGNVDSAGGVSLFSDNGDITQSGGTLHAGGAFSLDAAGLISVGDLSGDGGVGLTAAGDIDVTSVTSGGGASLQSTGGHAILRKAVLTGSGAGDDFSIVASGDAILGADDSSSITTDNVFSRTGGGSGGAEVRSTSGNALVFLDATAALDTLEGENAGALVNSGPVSIGAITANSGNVYVEAVDGALTVGSATAAGGDVELYTDNDDLTVTGAVHGGGLVDIESAGLLHLTSTSAVTSDDQVLLGGDTVTIAGSVHGDGPVQISANGLIDGTTASQISSGDDLTILGGAVDVGSLQADGQIGVGAVSGDVDIQSAHAGVLVQVIAFNGDIFIDTAQGDDLGVAAQALVGDVLVNNAKANGANGVVVVQAAGDATLRGAEATTGILVYASDTGKATFGADDAGSIDATIHYAMTAAGSGAGCGCGGPLPDGLQVYSEHGDAVVNAYSVSHPIALVRAGDGVGANAAVFLKTGDLNIDDLSGYNITVEAENGALQTGLTTSHGGDYTITARDFLGDALTPTLDNGVVRDVTVTDTLGDLDLGTAAIHADRRLTITALGGAVKGAAQLDAGTLGSALGVGQVVVTGEGIALDKVASDGLVTLDAGAGLLDVATSVSVNGDYNLVAGAFSDTVLAPLGSKLGDWSIDDMAGDFDFSGKTLRYGQNVSVVVHNGDVIGGDIISDGADVSVSANGGRLGGLHAGGGEVDARATVGGMSVDSADANTRIRIEAAAGAARLGSATLRDTTSTPTLLVNSTSGDVVLGAATSGAITAVNFVTSTGLPAAAQVTAPAGKVDINLDHVANASLTTVQGLRGVALRVANGPLTLDGAVTSGNTVLISAHGGLTIAATGTIQADGAGDAVVLASDGVFTNARGADAVTAANGRWLIYTQAFGDPSGSTAGNSFNGLVGKTFYGSAYDFGTDAFATAPNAGNRFVYAYQPTLTVTPVSQVVTYNGAIPTLSATVTGVLAGDLAADAWSGAPAVTGATSNNAGTYVLTAGAGGLVSDLNYAFAYGTGALRIDPRALTVTADDLSKMAGQRDPTLTYRITAGDLVAGDAFTGALARDAGETGGRYAITRGTLALSANYDLTFTGAVLTIQAIPSNEPNGGPALKHLTQSPDFTLDWDPESRLTTEGQASPQAPSQAAAGGGRVVAALR